MNVHGVTSNIYDVVTLIDVTITRSSDQQSHDLQIRNGLLQALDIPHHNFAIQAG